MIDRPATLPVSLVRRRLGGVLGTLPHCDATSFQQTLADEKMKNKMEAAGIEPASADAPE
jgi:hypothetical protein